MRQKSTAQLPLVVPASNHPRAKLLETVSRILDENPTLEEVVWQCLTEDLKNIGAQGLTAEQIIRLTFLKHYEHLTYDDLSFHLQETPIYQSFCRIGIGGKIPSRSAVASAVKSVPWEVWEGLSLHLNLYAAARGVEKGREVRVDCTVVESDIHKPSDSSLLYDCVRVITRVLKEIGFSGMHDRTRAAKRRMLEIMNSRGWKKRRGRYQVLMRLAREVVGYAEAALDEIDRGDLECEPVAAEHLRELVRLSHMVLEQTERRVIHGETVPALEKIVSIFEPHTDIIVKDRRDTYYGHKICLTAGRSNMVLDCRVLDGNPADSSLPVEMIERQESIYGRAPLKAAFDGGFASRGNLEEIRKLGVSDVCFSKKRGLKVEDMCRSEWVYRKLWRFRAGVESVISWLKRCFGLGRCMWRSRESFKSYVHSSIFTANLVTLATLII